MPTANADSEDDIDFFITLLGIHIYRLHKIFFLQFALKIPTYPHRMPHLVLARFLEAYFQRMTKMNLDPFLLWCREKKAGGLVYHCGLLLDGEHTCRSRHHLAAAELCWAEALDIDNAEELVEPFTTDRNGDPKVNGLMIKENPDDDLWAIRTCHQWLLYIDSRRPRWKKPFRDPQAYGFAWTDLSSGKVIAWSSAWRTELYRSADAEQSKCIDVPSAKPATGNLPRPRLLLCKR